MIYSQMMLLFIENILVTLSKKDENAHEDESDDDNDESKDEIDNQKIIREIKEVRDSRKDFRVKLNFDDKFLYYPKFKNEGQFSDLEL